MRRIILCGFWAKLPLCLTQCSNFYLGAVGIFLCQKMDKGLSTGIYCTLSGRPGLLNLSVPRFLPTHTKQLMAIQFRYASLFLVLLLAGCSGSSSITGDVFSLVPRLLGQATLVDGVARFTGKRADYTITKTSTGYSVKELTGLGLSTDVVAARSLQFSDISINLVVTDKAASIAVADLNKLLELYVAYFNRVPDADGLAYWIDQFKTGHSLEEIGNSFYSAALQYPAQTGYAASMSNADFIAIIYKNVLGRTSVDKAGLDYWTAALTKGTETRSSLVRSILNAAHSYKNDAQYGYVANLLDNKISTANYAAVQLGISYISATEAITKSQAIAAAVTSTDAVSATKLLDTVFGTGGPQIIAPTLTESQAARFLLQAQFSASDAEIASLRAKGTALWLNDQMNAPNSITGWDWLDSMGYNVISNDTRYYDQEYLSDRMIWNQLLTSPDAVRKRAALALSEMLVVSVSGVELTWRGHAMASYWDGLVANTFGNYRNLLENVTLNTATGKYLSTLGNQKETTAGRQPDENYAREVMQLYSIGLYQLNLDGTEKRDSNGDRIDTYSATDISNLARVFTGYVAQTDPKPPTLVPLNSNRSIPSTAVVKPPMKLTASLHSTLAVNFLGISIPANTDGTTALKIALDGLFNHPNVGPFLAKQMIQRLVTSNPTPAYVARVASVFNNNGSGVRGDLKAVFTAILLDDEARSDTIAAQDGSGKLREPMLRLVQWGRTFAEQADLQSLKLGDYSNPATQLSQSPLRSPTVFNFFRPGYVPPSTAMATVNRLAPEFQIVNESTVGGYVNMMQDVIRTGIYTTNSDVSGNTEGGANVTATYLNELPLAANPTALIARLNLLLTGGRLSSATQALILQTLTATNVTATSTTSAKLDRICLAVFLIMASPEYLVQK